MTPRTERGARRTGHPSALQNKRASEAQIDTRVAFWRPSSNEAAEARAYIEGHFVTRTNFSLISVIVTTYNRQDALTAVLRGLDRQTDRYFEVVVADDGSEPSTAALANRFGARHVWQSHNGFRAGTIRNRAVKASSGEYLIFLDGDCIPRSSFIDRHRTLAEAGWFVAGNRVNLSEAATNRLLGSGRARINNPLLARLRGDIDRITPFLALPLPRKLNPTRWEGAKSCNLGLWRSDFERIGGFDEGYEGWGYEDSDLVVRLIKAGVKRKDGRFSTGVVHLWHAARDLTLEPQNRTRLERTLEASRLEGSMADSRTRLAIEGRSQ